MEDLVKLAARYASQPHMPQGSNSFPTAGGMNAGMGGMGPSSRMFPMTPGLALGQGSQAAQRNPNPAANPAQPQGGTATVSGIQSALQKQGNARNKAQGDWLAMLTPHLHSSLKLAEVQTAGGSTGSATSTSSGNSSLGSSSSGMSGNSFGTTPGPVHSQNGQQNGQQQGQMGQNAQGMNGAQGQMQGGVQTGAFGLVQPGWAAIGPQTAGNAPGTKPSVLGGVQPGPIKTAGMGNAAGLPPTPGLTAPQGAPPQPGMAPPPAQMPPAMPPPNGGAPISPGMGQPSLDPNTGQPLPPPGPNPGQEGDPSQPGPQGPPPTPGAVDPLSGQPVTSPMQDAPPPQLPANPRMSPPRQAGPSDQMQGAVMGGLGADKMESDEPHNAQEAGADLQSHGMALGTKIAGDWLACLGLKSGFEKEALSPGLISGVFNRALGNFNKGVLPGGAATRGFMPQAKNLKSLLGPGAETAATSPDRIAAGMRLERFKGTVGNTFFRGTGGPNRASTYANNGPEVRSMSDVLMSPVSLKPAGITPAQMNTTLPPRPGTPAATPKPTPKPAPPPVAGVTPPWHTQYSGPGVRPPVPGGVKPAWIRLQEQNAAEMAPKPPPVKWGGDNGGYPFTLMTELAREAAGVKTTFEKAAVDVVLKDGTNLGDHRELGTKLAQRLYRAAEGNPTTQLLHDAMVDGLKKFASQDSDGKYDTNKSSTGESTGLKFNYKEDHHAKGQEAWESVSSYFKGHSRRTSQPNPSLGKHAFDKDAGLLQKLLGRTLPGGRPMLPGFRAGAKGEVAALKAGGPSPSTATTATFNHNAPETPSPAMTAGNSTLDGGMEGVRRTSPMLHHWLNGGQRLWGTAGAAGAGVAGKEMAAADAWLEKLAAPLPGGAWNAVKSFGQKNLPGVFGGAAKARPPIQPHLPGMGPHVQPSLPGMGGGAAAPTWGGAFGSARSHLAQSGGGAAMGAFAGENTPYDTGSTWGNAAVGAAAFNPFTRKMLGTRAGTLGNAPVRSIQASMMGADAGNVLDMGAGMAGLTDAEGNPTTNFGRMGGRLGAVAGGVSGAGRALNRLGGGQVKAFGNQMHAFGEGALAPFKAPFSAAQSAMGGGGANAFAKGLAGKNPMYQLGRKGGMAVGGLVGARQLMDGGKQSLTEHMLGAANEYADQKIPQIADYAEGRARQGMQGMGLAGEDGRFDPTRAVGQAAGQGVDHIFKSMGMDPSRLSPMQKMMMLGGGAAAGGGMLAGSPMLAGAGLLGAGAGYFGGGRPNYAGQQPGQVSPEVAQHLQSLTQGQGGVQGRNEWAHQQGGF